MNCAVTGQAPRAARAIVGVYARMARKRIFRRQTGGLPDFQSITERSGTPRRRWLIGKENASERYGSPPTVGGFLKWRCGIYPGTLKPADPIQRKKRGHHGELIHSGIKFSKFNGIRYHITGGRTGPSDVCGIRREFVHAKTR